MDAVLQKSMDMTVELCDASIKNVRPGIPTATIRAIQITSSPVDQIDNKNNNSVLIAGELIKREKNVLMFNKLMVAISRAFNYSQMAS